MGCCTGTQFTPAPDAALDVGQRVNFTFGMVLGVDDLRQEHAYLAGRDERALRETIGYGVISGLAVLAPAGDPQQVRVQPGLALLPDGHLVGVEAEQCADLTAWLKAETKAKREPGIAGRTTVHIILRFAEQSGTPVPIPGEPCRDESALQADARIRDSFSLDFSWTAPAQQEDNAVRSIAAWIRAIKVRDVLAATVPLEAFQLAVETGLRAAIAKLWDDKTRPPAVPVAAPDFGLPPPELHIPRAEYAEYINAAFEIWVRRLRADYLAHHGPVPAAEPLGERGLLLGAIDIKTMGVRMRGRPQLLHLRLLQEWLLHDGEQDAPREAHFLLGKADPKLGHAQDLHADFKTSDHALARVDIVPDKTDGGSGSKAVLRPAVKWPEGSKTTGGPDYYGPVMSQPIPVSDGGTGQAEGPKPGQLLVGAKQEGRDAARFVLGALTGGPGANIVIDVSSTAPNILLDTVQAIGTGASPTFAGLDINGSLTTGDLVVEKNADVRGHLSVSGELVLGSPLSRVLASDASGVVIAAAPWDGDEQALADAKQVYHYTPGQKAPVRIEDGGTGLSERPRRMQLLVGMDESDSQANGRYVLADLVAGQNIKLALDGGDGGFKLSIHAAGGGSGGGLSSVLAAGNLSNPPSLTAVTQGQQAIIDTVQPLHRQAVPLFQNLRIEKPAAQPANFLLGWNADSLELVRAELPDTGGGDGDVGVWPIRYAKQRTIPQITNKDQVVVVQSSGDLVLPDISKGLDSGFDEGRVIVVKAGPGVDALNIVNHDLESLTLKQGQSLTVIAALGLEKPGWLVIARS